MPIIRDFNLGSRRRGLGRNLETNDANLVLKVDVDLGHTVARKCRKHVVLRAFAILDVGLFGARDARGAREGEDERGNKRARLSDANVVRWRWAAGADGELRKESNTRFVRWSDGSLQLLLGDEVLDVKQIDVAGDHTYLFTRHQGMIQAQGQVCAQGG